MTEHIIGYHYSKKGNDFFSPRSPLSGKLMDIQFANATQEEINYAAELAKNCSVAYRKTSQVQRSIFLRDIAILLEHQKENIIDICHQETALPKSRLDGEMIRTCNQLRMFASLIEEKEWMQIIIEEAMPERTPLPRPDLRRILIPIGPVLVFGSSNFPLAFSVAGGDTAAALAAGCPVIMKAHPLHPQTSQLVGNCIRESALKNNLPDGVFSLLHGKSYSVGEQLVVHPFIKGASFTGSLKGGKALFDLATKRTEPIPFFAEMGSVNPIIIMKDALIKRYSDIASGILNSCTLGVGQFCTNPGLIIVEKCDVLPKFLTLIKEITSELIGEPMLSEQIANTYSEGIKRLKNNSKINLIAQGQSNHSFAEGVPHIFTTTAAVLINNSEIANEIFGPSTLIVVAENKEDILKVLDTIGGQLTATLFCENKNIQSYDTIIDKMVEKAGRVIFNSYPTGVEVGRAMQHGGPFPSSTDARFTSVGTMSIQRFLRPICYQDFPTQILPKTLQ